MTNKEPKETNPKVIEVLSMIDRGEYNVTRIRKQTGISRSYICLIKRTLGMRGSRKKTWCERRLDALLKEISSVRQTIPDHLKPYSNELHKLYSEAEWVISLLRRP